MFTLEQIKAAHSRVKSGADFPNYIQELKRIGVLCYETSVEDSHTNFKGNNEVVSTPPKYELKNISARVDAPQFASDLKAHQNGDTDYLTFCNDCAKSGINKWVVDIRQMTCTYYDTEGNVVLTEAIPV